MKTKPTLSISTASNRPGPLPNRGAVRTIKDHTMLCQNCNGAGIAYNPNTFNYSICIHCNGKGTV